MILCKENAPKPKGFEAFMELLLKFHWRPHPFIRMRSTLLSYSTMLAFLKEKKLPNLTT